MSPSYPNFAFTTDMWSDKYQHQNFISISIHYVDENWKLRKATLGMNKFDKQKTTVNIRADCERILKLYFKESEVAIIIQNSILVTDGGSNMTNIFPQRFPCQCHKLNLFVEWTLNDKPLATEKYMNKEIPPKKLFNLKTQCPNFQESLSSTKHLVTFFKQSALNSKLSKTMKQEVETRWNSELALINSYLDMKNEIAALLLEIGKLEKVSSINNAILEEFSKFLQPFKDSSDILSGDKYPTINLVALHFNMLEKHIEITHNDSCEMRNLKVRQHVVLKNIAWLKIFIMLLVCSIRGNI